MSQVNNDGDDENDASIQIGEDLVQSPVHKKADTGLVDFDGLLEKPLQIHETLRNGNGGQMWPAGMVLARYLLRKKRDELRQAESIIELGAGGGLVGLAVALGCNVEHEVHITDQEPMLELMQQNIELNLLQEKVKATVYDWGTAQPCALPKHPAIVLAADCVYFEPAFPLLQQTLQDLMGPETVCYFCFKKRRRADMQFLKTVKKMFDVVVITDDPDREIYSRQNIHLLALRLKAKK